MRKLRVAVVSAAVIAGVGILGVSSAAAFSGEGKATGWGSECRSHDADLGLLGGVSVLDGLLGNALSVQDNSDAWGSQVDSDSGCASTGY